MTPTKTLRCLVGALLLPTTFAAQALDTSGLYLDVKLIGARQSIGDDQRASPRQTALLSGSQADEFANGAIAVGKQVAANYRAELEYTAPQSTEFTSFWIPFNANANVFQLRSQRLMLNVYRELGLGSAWTGNLMLGLGAAVVEAKGWQGNTGRFLYEHSQTKAAASIGLGADYALAPGWKLGLGWRWVHIGNVRSGVNDYSTLAYNRTTGVGVQDETMRGKLREHNLFVALRKGF